jgi:hypothetical protein
MNALAHLTKSQLAFANRKLKMTMRFPLLACVQCSRALQNSELESVALKMQSLFTYSIEAW